MKADKQQSVQSRAAWELLGSETSQLYLLDDTQIRSLAVEKGCDVDLSESTSKADFPAFRVAPTKIMRPAANPIEPRAGEYKYILYGMFDLADLSF